MRIGFIAVVVAVVLFCGFGFLASFEPGVAIMWRVGYGVVGLAAIAAGAVAIVGGRN